MVVYVVWSSQVGGKERNVPKAATLVPDRRALQYWDEGQWVGKAFQPILRTPEAAWDVWMLFDRGARWEGKNPPRPSWWEHQLYRMPEELLLDPARFARKALEIGKKR